MKKRAASIALVLSMILSFTCQAGAVDANSGDDGQQVSTYAALEASAQSGGLTKLNAVKYILLDCGMKETQFPSGDSDYIAMAKSVGIADDKFDGSAACSLEELHTMANSTAAVNLRNAVKNGTPLFVNGVAQPIFPYTSGVPTAEGYSNKNSDIIRYSVYVETNYDTDDDGKLDLVKALVQLPRPPWRGTIRPPPSMRPGPTSPAVPPAMCLTARRAMTSPSSTASPRPAPRGGGHHRRSGRRGRLL